ARAPGGPVAAGVRAGRSPALGRPPRARSDPAGRESDRRAVAGPGAGARSPGSRWRGSPKGPRAGAGLNGARWWESPDAPVSARQRRVNAEAHRDGPKVGDDVQSMLLRGHDRRDASVVQAARAVHGGLRVAVDEAPLDDRVGDQSDRSGM